MRRFLDGAYADEVEAQRKCMILESGGHVEDGARNW